MLSQNSGSEAASPIENVTRRINLACEVAGEVHSLAKIVHEHLEVDGSGLALRSMLRRIMRLSNIQLSALTDELESIEQITARFSEAELA